jgi:hypothetical protein
MALLGIAGAFQDVLARTHQFDDRQRQIGKVIGIRCLARRQEVVERFRIGRRRQMASDCSREFDDPVPALRRLDHSPDRRDLSQQPGHDFV